MPSVIIQPDEAEAIDTTLEAQNHNNYGSLTYVLASNASSTIGYRLLLKFLLSSIPVGATITAATLSVYRYVWDGSSANGTTAFCRHLKRAWTESGADWYHADHATLATWGGNGVTSSTDRSDTAATFGYSGGNTPQWWNFNVLSDVQAHYGGTLTNNGWVISADNGTGNHFIRGSGYTDPTYRPKLEVTYTGTGSTCPVHLLRTRQINPSFVGGM